MIKLALLTQSFIGVFRRKNFFYKLFNSFLAFFLIFSLAFVTIETVDPEPVFAASWDCFDSSGRPIAFQTKYSSGSLQVKRYNFSTNTESTTTFSSGFQGSGEINASFMDLDGMGSFAITFAIMLGVYIGVLIVVGLGIKAYGKVD